MRQIGHLIFLMLLSHMLQASASQDMFELSRRTNRPQTMRPSPYINQRYLTSNLDTRPASVRLIDQMANCTSPFEFETMVDYFDAWQAGKREYLDNYLNKFNVNELLKHEIIKDLAVKSRNNLIPVSDQIAQEFTSLSNQWMWDDHEINLAVNESCYYLGSMFFHGRMVNKNFRASKMWFEKSANTGHRASQYMLNLLYRHGLGCLEDSQIADQWLIHTKAAGYKFDDNIFFQQQSEPNYLYSMLERQHNQLLKAALYGHDEAQVILGIKYLLTEPKSAANQLKAFNYFTKAAIRNNVEASVGLGIIHMICSLHLYDLGKSISYFKNAALCGHPIAQFNLGFLFENGIGVVKNNQEAFSWYVVAADNENGAAQSNLALMYLYGHGVVKDVNKAIQLFLRAAEQGIAGAYYNLGEIYQMGLEVKKNQQLAINYYRLAEKYGHNYAAIRLRQINPFKERHLRRHNFSLFSQ